MIKKVSLRFGLSLLLITLQLLLLLSAGSSLLWLYPRLSQFGIVISWLVFMWLLRKDEAADYKLTWVIMVMSFPVVGGVLYLTFNKSQYVRRKIAAHAKEHAIIAKLLDADGVMDFPKFHSEGKRSLFRYVRQASAYHGYEHTTTQYYPWGQDMFADMLTALQGAERFILLEYFIVKSSTMWDELVVILEQKVAQGVEVRVIIDDFGSQKLFTNAYIAQLRAKGIQVLRFNPIIPILFVFMNTRDHRKIMVIDGDTAFVGGVNIADEYVNRTAPLGTWKDTGLKLQGQGVWSLTLMFIEMWDTFAGKVGRIDNHQDYAPLDVVAHPSDGLVLPYGDSPLDGERLGENIYIEILNQARQYVYIFTPYLIISEKLSHALQMAAARGVDVRIVTPGIPDKKLVFRLTRSYYARLITAGVRIYEYTPGFMHAKSFVCDDDTAVVGTINLDYRSLYLHFENAVLIHQASTVAAIKADALATIAHSRQIPLAEVSKYKWIGLVDAVLHLFAPLM